MRALLLSEDESLIITIIINIIIIIIIELTCPIGVRLPQTRPLMPEMNQTYFSLLWNTWWKNLFWGIMFNFFSWFCSMFICGNNFHLKVDINAVDFSLSTGPNLKMLVILKRYFWSAASIYCQLLKLANSHLDALELRCNVIASTSVAESWSIEIMLLLHSMLLILMATYVCTDINGVSNTEHCLPSAMNGREPVKVTLEKTQGDPGKKVKKTLEKNQSQPRQKENIGF